MGNRVVPVLCLGLCFGWKSDLGQWRGVRGEWNGSVGVEVTGVAQDRGVHLLVMGRAVS